MKKSFIIAVLMTVAVTIANAQGALKKVYNENINPMEQSTKLSPKLRPTTNMLYVR